MMVKIGPYSRLYPRWQEAQLDKGIPIEITLRWSVLLQNRYGNPSGLYEFNLPGLAELCCWTCEELSAALELWAEKGELAWDAKTNCLFVFNKIHYQYDSLLLSNNSVRGLLKVIEGLRHLSLYSLLLEKYDELAPALPGPREKPSARANGNGNGDTPLMFQPPASAKPATPARTQPGGAAAAPRRANKTPQDKYLALRESAPSGVVRVYDALAPIFREHSRQPRGEKEWAGMEADLRALASVDAGSRNTLTKLVPALAAVFVERWPELDYFITGSGNVQTISGLNTKWKDGTMKAVNIVKRWEAALARRRAEGTAASGTEEEERREELSRLKAEYQALKEAPGVTQDELAALAQRIRKLQEAVKAEVKGNA